MASDHKTEIEVQSYAWGATGAAPAASATADLKPPPVDGASGDGHVKVPHGPGAAAGEEHEIEYDIVVAKASGEDADQQQSGVDVRGWDPGQKKAIIGEAEAPGGTNDGEYMLTSVQHSGAGAGAGKVQLQDFPFSDAGDGDANVQGSANGGVWKTTNFETGETPEPEAAFHGYLKVEDIPGESQSSAGKMHMEDISVAPSEPEPSANVFMKLGDIPGEAEEGPGDLTGETPTAGAAFDAFLKLGDIPGESESAAGKMHMEDISVAPSEPEPSANVFMKLGDIPGEAEDASGGGAGKVSVHDISIMDDDDGPSALADLKPKGGGEQTYLAVKLENVQITSYSIHGDAGDSDGGTEHEDSWEDAL